MSGLLAIVVAAGLALLGAEPRAVVLGPAPPVVDVGETATWTVRLEGFESRPSLVLPDVAGLDLDAGAPRRDEVRALRDGVVVPWPRSAIDVRATASAEGRFVLPPVLVGDGDVAWHTEPSAPLVVGGGPGPAGPDVAFCEVVSATEEVFLGEPFRATVRFGFAEEFLDSSLVPLFPRRLDVPAQLGLPWIGGHPDARVAGIDGADARATFALEDRAGTARRVDGVERDGRRFTVLELERRIVPTASGPLALAAPTLRYAYATAFREGLFERTPVDRHEAVAAGAPAVVRVRPLPDDGRPSAFAGAVGRFPLAATAEPRALAVGETLRVVVTIDADGDVEPGAPPPLALGDGLHVLGRRDEVDDVGRRTVTIDATPTRGDVAAVEAIRFAWFDPEAGAYRTVETASIPLAVEGPSGPVATRTDAEAEADGGAASEPPSTVRAIPGVNDLVDVRPVSVAIDLEAVSVGALSWRVGWIGGGVVLPWSIGLAFLLAWRARERRRRDPAGFRARRAADAFRATVRRPGADPVAAFESYLAARLRTSEAAVVGHELEGRLVGAGVPPLLAAEAARDLERRRAARFGGPPAEAEGELGARVELLERAFADAEGRA